MKVRFQISWRKRQAKVIVTDYLGGGVFTEDIAADDDETFRYLIQSEIRYYGRVQTEVV